MSKRTRYADNSKRQQPVQQQRAQAAAKQFGTANGSKKREQQAQSTPDDGKSNR